MFFHLKIIIRNLQRGGIYSYINVGGLAIGMAAAILIVSWIYHEWSYDRFHAKENQLYVTYNRSTVDGNIWCWDWTPFPLGPTLKTDYPDIVAMARLLDRSFLYTNGDNKFNINTGVVDPDFLTMFDFPFLHGDTETALNDPYSVILTEKAAIRLFGQENPIGETLLVSNQHLMTVAGVMKDLPNNTKFNRFEAFISIEFTKILGWHDEEWQNNQMQTYIELHPLARLDLVNEDIRDITNAHTNNEAKTEVFLYPFGKQHLYSKFENGVAIGGLIDTLRMFAVFAVLIVLIACINFMNLSTARSGKRAKEVGVRKVLGGKRFSLIGLFLKESMTVSFIAGSIAVIIALMVLPLLETMVGQFPINLESVWFWLSILGFILFTGLLAGSYPAFFLSSFRPMKTLKGFVRTKQSLLSSRKILVVLQFTAATALIASTMVIHRQIKHTQGRDVGFNKDQLIYTSLGGETGKNFELIKQDLLNSRTATSVAKTFSPMSRAQSNTWSVWWKGKETEERILFDVYFVEADWTKTVGATIIEGRDIDIHTFATDSTALLLNETAVKIMNFENPIGETVSYWGIDGHVVGVVKDFIIRSPYDPVAPMLIGGPSGFFNTMHIKLNGNNRMADNLAQAEQIFRQYNPAFPFEYKFVDEEYARKFHEEQKIGSLLTWFAGLTIFISCMGLFALVAYMAETRRKEIGIRKVLGASVYDIVHLLSKEFLILVSISIAVSTPIAWRAMEKWLSNYAYRTDIPWWLFFVVGGMSLFIALATVGFQAVKAAMENPVEAIKSE